MKMVGHKTESIYRRYAIVDETIALHEAQAPATPAIPVIPLSAPTNTKRVGPSTGRVRRAASGPRRRALSPYRRARTQWWAGTGLNRRHQDFQS
jgi:hypothetical protein